MTDSCVNLRTEAGFKLTIGCTRPTRSLRRRPPSPASCCGPSPPRAIPQRGFNSRPGDYYARQVEELRPLTYSLVGRKSKLRPKDEWTACLGHSPDVADAIIQSVILIP